MATIKGILMFKVGGMIRSPSKKTLDTKEGMQTAMRLLNGIPCSPLKDMFFTKSLCTLEDALKGVGLCVQVWILLPQNQIGCNKGIVRKSKQDKGDMWAISNKEKNTKVGTTTKQRD